MPRPYKKPFKKVAQCTGCDAPLMWITCKPLWCGSCRRLRAAQSQRAWKERNNPKVKFVEAKRKISARERRLLFNPPKPPLTEEERRRRVKETHMRWRAKEQNRIKRLQYMQKYKAENPEMVKLKGRDSARRYAREARAARMALAELGIECERPSYAHRALREIGIIVQLGEEA